MARTDRIAVALDLENLLGGRPAGDGVGDVIDVLARIRCSRVAVALVAYCARGLQQRIAFELLPLGVRVFGHADPRPDAADRLLLAYLERELPLSVGTVVIGSGDHIFVSAASDLRDRGLRVEVAARPGALAASLYRCCDYWYPVGEVMARPATGQDLELVAA
jgi:hypothetical protein